MGMILRIASSRIVGQGDIVGRSGYFSLNLSANSVMRGRLDARRTLKSLVADLRITLGSGCNSRDCPFFEVDWCDTICFAIYENKRVTLEMDWWMSVVDCCYIYDRQLYGTGICPLCSRNIRL